MNNSSLTQLKCEPCSGNTPKLSSEESFGVLPEQGSHFNFVNKELFILYVLHLFDLIPSNIENL